MASTIRRQESHASSRLMANPLHVNWWGTEKYLKKTVLRVEIRCRWWNCCNWWCSLGCQSSELQVLTTCFCIARRPIFFGLIWRTKRKKDQARRVERTPFNGFKKEKIIAKVICYWWSRYWCFCCWFGATAQEAAALPAAAAAAAAPSLLLPPPCCCLCLRIIECNIAARPSSEWLACYAVCPSKLAPFRVRHAGQISDSRAVTARSKITRFLHQCGPTSLEPSINLVRRHFVQRPKQHLLPGSRVDYLSITWSLPFEHVLIAIRARGNCYSGTWSPYGHVIIAIWARDHHSNAWLLLFEHVITYQTRVLCYSSTWWSPFEQVIIAIRARDHLSTRDHCYSSTWSPFEQVVIAIRANCDSFTWW